MNYESFRDFQRPKKGKEQPVMEELSPEEQFIENYNELKESVKKESLQLTLDLPPEFFEELVVKLLVAMGCGGTIENILGLDMIYIQAKRWQGNMCHNR